ncbi:serine/threonine-protein kinase AtPK2/AtPK19-like [Galendromus occidentalis]|uniref:Serine/threonine-protein kinase greatwall n=1 Tax=Galendromus occidentalis TaxID=34638 RepID=A0AAJ6VYG5_9ACAR|nr:serine/threonine-protein kinase AtPK2/AtPK19-like [Galendromus occidentalis]
MSTETRKELMLTKRPMAPANSKINTENTALDTITSIDDAGKDVSTMGPARKSKKFRKHTGPLMKAVDMALPGVALHTRKLLHVYAKDNGQVDLKRFPREHHCRVQVQLLAIDLNRGIKSFDLTYVVVREGLENLWGLMEYSKRDDPRSAGILGFQTEKLVLAIEQIAALLEDYSNVKPTNWIKVAELFQKEAYACSQHSVPYVPAKMKYFKLDKLLGAGGFGAVYKAYLGNVVCTVKFVPCDRLLEPKYACMDKLVACMANHPFVVKYYACFATKQAFVTSMEYIKGCDLNKVLIMAVYFPEKITRIIIAQLGDALAHMHSKGFIHRDIKPANMIIMNGCRIKLIDFDTAKACIGKYVAKAQSTFNWRTAFEFNDNEVAGTMPYFPPECCPLNPHMNNLYGRSMDWWAVGVTAFQLATGRLPFHNFRSEHELKTLINSGQYVWPNDRAFSAPLVQFVAELLTVKPHERLCSKSYSDFRSHSFFCALDWQMLATADFLKDFHTINRCMTRTNAGYSPVGSPEAERRRFALFPHQILDTTDHSNLYTYCSPGFCRAVAEIKAGNSPTKEMITDPLEIADDVDWSYRFEDL